MKLESEYLEKVQHLKAKKHLEHLKGTGHERTESNTNSKALHRL